MNDKKSLDKPLAHYFVTDIECDGPTPNTSSMLSFASVAVREDGKICSEFEAVLQPLLNKKPNERTMEFWRAHPEAWSAATTNPEDPEVVMSRFADWVLGFEGGRSFAARPLAFDGIWMDHYLREFAGYHLLDSAHLGKQLFSASALDLGSYMSGIFGRTKPPMDLDIPKDWLGDHPHTHRAIDDARGYAFFLSRLLRIAERQPGHPEDFLNLRN